MEQKSKGHIFNFIKSLNLHHPNEHRHPVKRINIYIPQPKLSVCQKNAVSLHGCIENISRLSLRTVEKLQNAF